MDLKTHRIAIMTSMIRRLLSRFLPLTVIEQKETYASFAWTGPMIVYFIRVAINASVNNVDKDSRCEHDIKCVRYAGIGLRI